MLSCHTFDVELRFCRMAVILTVLACHSANGNDSFLSETDTRFWDTNLVATVIGYGSQRTFMGVKIPVMGNMSQPAEEVWLYSVAPTNYAGIEFKLHFCGVLDLPKIFPTNQLFVFPASPVVRDNNCTNLYTPIYSDFQNFRDYCPYRTCSTRFLITDSDVQYWISDWRIWIEQEKTREIKLRSELAKTNDDRKRSNIVRRIERQEELIRKCQCAIDEAQIQSTNFPSRIQWLNTQGVYPTQ